MVWVCLAGRRPAPHRGHGLDDTTNASEYDPFPTVKAVGFYIHEQPDILVLSALLTTTMPYMKAVIDTMKEQGIRNDFTVGSVPLNEESGIVSGVLRRAY